MNWLQITSSIIIPVVSAMATIGAAVVAVWGIMTWRREHVGKKRIDLAENVLALAYEAKDFYEAVRMPLSREGDGSSRQKSPDETEAETRMLNEAFIQIEMCSNRPELFARFRSLRYRFMAQNGQDAGDLLEKLSNVRFDISRPYRKLLLRIKNLRRKHYRKRDSGKYNDDLNEIWEEIAREIDGFDDEASDTEDTVLRKVDKLVLDIEKICVETIGCRK